MIHRRRRTALVLTVFALALGTVLVATYGRDALIIYFSQLPVALALFWVSTGAERFDESRDASKDERSLPDAPAPGHHADAHG